MTKILISTKFDEIRDLWQNFWRNLHFLTNEKWHFWWQNPLESTHVQWCTITVNKMNNILLQIKLGRHLHYCTFSLFKQNFFWRFWDFQEKSPYFRTHKDESQISGRIFKASAKCNYQPLYKRTVSCFSNDTDLLLLISQQHTISHKNRTTGRQCE